MRHAYKTAMLVIGDIAVLYLSLGLMLTVRYGSLTEAPLVREHFAPFTIVFAFWLIVFFIHNLYDFTAAKNSLEFYRTVFRALFINGVIALTFFYLVPFFAISPKRNLALFFVIFVVLFALWRQVANRLFKTRLHLPTLVMGRDTKVAPLAATLNNNPQIGYRVVGVFTDEVHEGHNRGFVTFTRQDLLDLERIVEEHTIQTIIVEESILENDDVVRQLDRLIGRDVAVLDFTNFKERLTRKVDLEEISERWFLEHAAAGRNLTYDALKRLLDILAVLVFALPACMIGIFITLAIKLQDGGPIFFKQKRTGQYERPFFVIKFRSMVVNADRAGAQITIDNDPRITPIGRFIRKVRLDELPQFINILKGEMSFVGPRSEQRAFDERFISALPFYERRYLVKPGLTGWAQINYSSVITLEDARERMAYDFFYLKNRSLIFDVGVILRTIDLMFRGRGR